MTATHTRIYQGLPAQERTAQRRQRLLEAAITVYGTVGFRAGKVKLVCLEAGLTERYFYESFANSEELLCAACGSAMELMREQALRAAAAGATPAQRIWTASATYFAYLRAHPAVARLTLFEMEGVDAGVDDFLRAELQKTTELIRVLLFGEALAGPVPELDPELLARGMLGALYQLAKEWTRAGFQQSDATMARHVRAIALGVVGQDIPGALPA